MLQTLDHKRIAQFARLKVLVLGDLMLDKYLSGTVERTSPEAPVMVVHYQNERDLIGGAGNVACNLAEFGCKVGQAGVIGSDDAGKRLKNLMRDRKISTTAIFSDRNRPTTEKTRIMAGNQQMLRIDREDTAEILPATLDRLVGWLEKNIARYDGLIISDYNKGVVTPKLLAKIFQISKKDSVPVLIDPKGKDYKRYKGCTVIKPNKVEAYDATGIRVESNSDAEKAAKQLAKITGAKVVALTRGADGLTIYEKGKQTNHIAAIRHEVFDVTGAGDTFAAFFGMGIFASWSALDAARLGNLASSIAVQKIGNATISAVELLQTLGQSQPAAKLRTLEEVSRIAREMKTRKKKIVFTNGCFDLLHFGHIHFLEESRKRGDCLIVGLNSDRVIKKIKGKGRPYIDESQRARLISALACVDFLVFFDEDTPVKVIEAIRPDVLTKGTNYSEKEIIGRESLKQTGGIVERIPIDAGISTEQLVDRIRNDK